MANSVVVLECDYLVIGSGVTGMAFVDEMIHGNSEIKVILVDKRAKPGGHWVDAYSFVRLHQPSALYGVNSKPLGNGKEEYKFMKNFNLKCQMDSMGMTDVINTSY